MIYKDNSLKEGRKEGRKERKSEQLKIKFENKEWSGYYL